MAAEDGLVLLRGQWVEVDREQLAEALDHWKQVEASAGDGLSFVEGMRLLAGAPQDLADGDERSTSSASGRSSRPASGWGSCSTDLRSPENLQAAKPGAALKATLREYQETGVSWLSFLSSLGLGACLADDMGLGKTIQVLALLLLLKKKRNSGASRRCWSCRRRCWPTGNRRSSGSLRRSAPRSSIRRKRRQGRPGPDGRATGRELRGRRRRADHLRHAAAASRGCWTSPGNWSCSTRRRRSRTRRPGRRRPSSGCKADARIALTGTPVENRLSDLWSLFDFLCPGLLGSQQKFKEFVKRLERPRARQPLRAAAQPGSALHSATA